MSEAHERRTLFESSGIAVVDFRCTAANERNSPEEPNPAHSIALVRRGVFCRTARGQTIVADTGRVLFFNAGHAYQYAHPVPGGDDCTILTIAPDAALELVARYAPREAERPDVPFSRGHGLATIRTAALHYELLRAMRRQPSALSVEDTLAELADAAVACAFSVGPVRTGAYAAARRRRRDLVDAAKLAINRQLDALPSLRSLARALECSPFHLSRSFHREEGVSLREYVRRLRARAAAHHLARGAADLTELALRLGYTDHSHFTNAFHREWGVPPSRFRARYR